MVGVLPEPQAAKDGVAAVDDAVTVPTVPRLVVLGKGVKAVLKYSGGRGRLWRVISEQLTTVIDKSVVVAVEGEPGVVRARASPRKSFCRPVRVDVEVDTSERVREAETVPRYVD